MMSNRATHDGLVGLLGIGALSAIGGGVALVAGRFDDVFPTGWLDATPFTTYTGPGLILGGIVGGSQLVALAGVLQRRDWAMPATGLAGCTMMGWIVGEVLLLGSEPGLMRRLQAFCFADGLLELLLAVEQRRSDHGLQSSRARSTVSRTTS